MKILATLNEVISFFIILLPDFYHLASVGDQNHHYFYMTSWLWLNRGIYWLFCVKKTRWPNRVGLEIRIEDVHWYRLFAYHNPTLVPQSSNHQPPVCTSAQFPLKKEINMKYIKFQNSLEIFFYYHQSNCHYLDLKWWIVAPR